MTDAPKKELKVSIPFPTYMALLRLKLLAGQPIGVTVEHALRAYFATIEMPRVPGLGADDLAAAAWTPGPE